MARGAGYVALGDSYTAGPLIPKPIPLYGCLKSSNNFPHLTAPRIGLPLRVASCSGAETGFGCWPQMPIGFADVPYLRAKQRQLNATIANQAAANGATLVDWYGASIGHDACQGPLTRWVEPLVPTQPAAPIHPNLAGMRGGANVLVAAIAG